MIAMGGAKAYACDICGCGVGSYYIGLLPEFKKHFFGFRYQYKTLRTHIGADGVSSYLTSDETYQTAELWGGWNIGKRFRVLTFLPYNFDSRLNQDSTHRKNGIGDIAVVGYYELFNSRATIGDHLLVQSLWVGGGFKLATGGYEPYERDIYASLPNTFQLGTGSTDFTLNAAYDIRFQDLGLNSNVSYKINTANKYDYRYGNKLSVNSQAYYKFNLHRVVTIVPNVGVLYERAAKDVSENKYQEDQSGGYSLMGSAGVEISFAKFSVGSNFQAPLSQRLAGGSVKAFNRAMVHVSFTL